MESCLFTQISCPFVLDGHNVESNDAPSERAQCAAQCGCGITVCLDALPCIICHVGESADTQDTTDEKDESFHGSLRFFGLIVEFAEFALDGQ